MTVKPAYLIAVGIFLLQGCSALNHTEEISTLRSLSRKQADLDKYVEERDEFFLSLLEKVKNGEVSQYQRQKEIIKAFGEPIFQDTEDRNGIVLTKWLYRKQVEFFDTDKVYLYFDDAGVLKSWDIEFKE